MASWAGARLVSPRMTLSRRDEGGIGSAGVCACASIIRSCTVVFALVPCGRLHGAGASLMRQHKQPHREPGACGVPQQVQAAVTFSGLPPKRAIYRADRGD